MTEPPSMPIDTPPRSGQNINHEGKEYTTIQEGLAHILVPHGIPTSTDPRMSKEDSQKQQVFYNPIQQFNRDLSVLAIKTYGQDAIQRKREKHEKAIKKAVRKKKRKYDDNEECLDESATKRRKSINGADVSVSGTNEVPMLNTPAKVTLGDATAENRPTWTPQFSILDALSATGLRALRYATEIPFATSVTANDMSEKATASIALNVKHNKLSEKIQAHTSNAIAYMYSYVDKKGYDVIDLDPYGTAAPFIDSALQAINDEGLLCVTCTDSAIFASHGYLEKTYSQYGGLPLKGDACHEGGIRLILHAIASSAGRYGMAIEPLLSLSIDYYIRVFVRVRKSPNDVKHLAGKTMIVYHCDSGCGSWSTQFLARNKTQQNKNGDIFYKHSFALGPSANEQCEHCGFKTHLCGPMYGGPLHNVEFIKRVLAQLKEADHQTYPTMDRMEGMLRMALEETTLGAGITAKQGSEVEQLDPLIPKVDPTTIDHHPFFFVPSAVSKIIHCSAPSAASVRGALRQAGFRVTMSHCKPGSMKTDASWKDIWHIMLEWVRQKAPLKNPLKKESAGYAIMSKGSAHNPTLAGSKDNSHKKGSNSALPSSEHHLSDQNIENKPIDGFEDNGHEDPLELDAKASSNRPCYLDKNFEVKFDEKVGKDLDRGKYVRYQLAPRENWGPMSRAK